MINTSGRSRERNSSGCGESTTPKQTLKTINPPRMTWIKQLLRLLHITRSKTVLHHEQLPIIVKSPITDPFQAVDDDPPSDLVDLPYDIIIDILSRLPAKYIFKCQCMSRPLQVLTTNPFFIHMQRQRSTPIIVIQLFSESVCQFTKLYFMDEEFERIEEKFAKVGSLDIKPIVTSTPDPSFLLSSYEGFLVFTNFSLRPTFYMWNPITEKQLTIKYSKMHVCGLYFNPVKRDHELLYYTTDGHSEQYCNFGACNLRTKLRRDVGSFCYPPSRYRSPIVIKGTLLYWMIDRSHFSWLNRRVIPPFSDSIMSFNIKTEEFSTLEPGGRKFSTTEPGEQYSEGLLRIDQLQLSEMDGELCLCDFVTYNQLLLSIFNHETKCWSTNTIVILPEIHISPLQEWPNKFAVEVVQIKDNELLVRQGKRLVLYNMLSHACKISEIMGSEDKCIRVAVHIDTVASFHL